MKPSVIVRDLETVPDLGGVAAADGLVGKSDVVFMSIREALIAVVASLVMMAPALAGTANDLKYALECGAAKTTPPDVFVPELTMPKVNLSGMSLEALMDLREQVDETLLKRRAEIEKQLARMGAVVSGTSGGGSALRGRKVPPKYRGPSGETWAGRGAKPRWLVDAIKDGRKIDHFLIDKSARKGRKKRR
jgi:DNA-binding protein H-NS